MKTISYKKSLLKNLKGDAAYCLAYIEAAYEETEGAFLLACKDVVEANKDFKPPAK